MAPLLASLPLVAIALACATPVGVDRRDPNVVRRKLAASVLTTGEPSHSTNLVLQRFGLAEAYEDEPDAVVAAIQEGLADAPDRADRTFALAELSFHQGITGGDRGDYLGAVVFAYAYLFPPVPGDRAGPLDPRLRIAVDLYNQGLAEGLRARGSDLVDLSPRAVSTPAGELDLSMDEQSLTWGRYRLVEFVPSVEYHVRGMRNRYRTPGVGAALVAGLQRIEGAEIPRGHRLPDRLRVPVTALLRIEDVHEQLGSGRVAGRLEVFVQDRSEVVELEGEQVPLEYETTMALAYTLEGSPIWDFELAGFRVGDLNPLGGSAPDGLFLLAPYHPGRVPLVLVHGTASSPARWAELINEIMGDPTLNQRVQLWLFIYPTGNPILVSAANLRDALVATVSDLDPEGTDWALQNMVIAGHSQGGLLTKLQAVDADGSFWANISDLPFDEVALSEETRDLVQRAAFFEALPFVTRVLFLATPHGGSFLASFRLSNLASSLVTLPLDLAQRGVELVDLNESRGVARKLDRLPTSIDNMRPGHPFLTALHPKPLAERTTGHSIIGVPEAGPSEGQNDGVVAYESAHIEGVASELHVRSGHSLQAHPDTINEVKRILRVHLDELEAMDAPAAPAEMEMGAPDDGSAPGPPSS
jgi:triacylglycerol esterase/lipase EstA (alpha/beta hydrolase family)